jgi:predicted permease
MESVLQDLRQAGRALRKSPLFTGLAVATLALGIGSTATILTVVDRVLLRPLPYRDSQALVKVWERNDGLHVERNIVNPQNFLDWRDRAKSFSGLASYTWSSMVITDGDIPERVLGRAVTPDMFTVLGASPALGRTFTDAEALPGAASVIILSDGLWRRRFGGDPNVVGTTVHTSDGTATVIGVMPRTFRPLGNEEYWDAFKLDPAQRAQRRGRYAMVVGRLAPGAALEHAQQEMDGIAKSLEKENPLSDAGWGISVIPMRDDTVQEARTVLWMTLGAVSLVLLITCANVGNLMLTRALARGREAAVRTALGATRWRLARQWLAENLLLASAGGALGLLLATWGVALIVSAQPASVPRVHEIAIDGRVFAGVTAITVCVGLLIALPAALQGRGARLSAALHGDTGRTTGSARVSRFRAGLVVAQMSLAVTLLFGAGLLLRSIARLSAVEPGFDPNNVLSVAVGMPDATYPDADRQTAFVRGIETRLAALPGVRAVGAVNFLPLTGMDAATSFVPLDRPAPPPGQDPVAAIRIADPNYFSTMHIPLRRGRLFTDADREKTLPVVVVSDALARRTWPGEDPVGKELTISWTHADQHVTVIGVVADVRVELDEDPRRMIYYPIAQQGSGYMNLVIRADADPAALAPAVRAAIHDADRSIPAEDLATMATWITRSMADRRDPMFLLALFAGLAVTIAAVGVYAVLSYGVAQRTREIGVRIALGALPASVVRMVLASGLRLALAGIAIGLVAGFFASRALGKLLFQISPADPFTFGAVALLLALVALTATWLPARRAARVDPMVALRTE